LKEFEPFQKNEKAFFSPSPFQPSRPSLSIFFFPAQSFHRRPVPRLQAQSGPAPSLPLSRGARPSSPTSGRTRTLPESGRSTLRAPPRLGVARTPRPRSAPIKATPRDPPLNPPNPQPPPLAFANPSSHPPQDRARANAAPPIPPCSRRLRPFQEHRVKVVMLFDPFFPSILLVRARISSPEQAPPPLRHAP